VNGASVGRQKRPKMTLKQMSGALPWVCVVYWPRMACACEIANSCEMV